MDIGPVSNPTFNVQAAPVRIMGILSKKPETAHQEESTMNFLSTKHVFSFVLALSCVTRAEDRVPGTLNFADVTATHIVQNVAESHNNEKEVALGDFDNDGDLDVVIADAFSDFGQRRNKLYENDGGVFVEISGAPVIPGFSFVDMSRNAFFRDFNEDGWLDILISNDANTGGAGGRVKVYINNPSGDGSRTFVDEGLSRFPTWSAGAASAVSMDFDDDGDFDLYVASTPNQSQDRLYNNLGLGFFEDVTVANVPADGDFTTDVAAADMNGDGSLDLLLSVWTVDQGSIYYNNALNGGSGPGDFSYANSVQLLSAAGALENAKEPGDFDGDGRMDVYLSNGGFAGEDLILHNVGNGPFDHVAFEVIAPPQSYPGASPSRKVTVSDLNRDGRDDLIVMVDSFENSRPAILRNTTVNGDISFVDWTPGNTFPTGQLHRGWHAAIFDADGDGWQDIFLGGWANDHLFRNVASVETTDSELGGVLPDLVNVDPIAVVGEVSESDTFTSSDSGGEILSVVLNGCSDLFLEALDHNGGAVLAASDRGGFGVEEAFQLEPPLAGYILRVTLNQACGDADDDDDIDLGDFESFVDCRTAPGVPLDEACRSMDFDSDGDVDWADFAGLQRKFTGIDGIASGDYVLEALSRD